MIYRSDGANRGQGGNDGSSAGWGSAVWPATADGRGFGAPLATARGFLGNDITNNFAEYAGLWQCMRRAARILDPIVKFEVDSMLLAKQMAQINTWACRSDNLMDLHIECVRLGNILSDRGVIWNVTHIYREFNQTADALSNQAIDEIDTNGFSPDS